MPGLITDFLISLDDRYLYFVNWLHGDVRQYNIEDPSKPVLTGQVWVGGLLQKGSDVVYVAEDGTESQFSVPVIKVSILVYLHSCSIFNISTIVLHASCVHFKLLVLSLLFVD
ncbi:hypothetical protein GW17_00024624 [Ensete ventricosum]|nr:hypothetical protein GW17_00024624 [Ensete ventricosum]